MSPLKRNIDIRLEKGKIPYWLIAEKLGIHENTLRIWLRRKLSSEKKQEILAAIEKAKQESLAGEAHD